jgi:hypothetical protein
MTTIETKTEIKFKIGDVEVFVPSNCSVEIKGSRITISPFLAQEFEVRRSEIDSEAHCSRSVDALHPRRLSPVVQSPEPLDSEDEYNDSLTAYSTQPILISDLGSDIYEEDFSFDSPFECQRFFPTDTPIKSARVKSAELKQAINKIKDSLENYTFPSNEFELSLNDFDIEEGLLKHDADCFVLILFQRPPSATISPVQQRHVEDELPSLFFKLKQHLSKQIFESDMKAESNNLCKYYPVTKASQHLVKKSITPELEDDEVGALVLFTAGRKTIIYKFKDDINRMYEYESEINGAVRQYVLGKFKVETREF